MNWNEEAIQEMYFKCKPFSKQFTECMESGNCIKINTSPMKKLYGHDVGEILICVKHKSICNSSVCKEERMALKG